MTWLSFRSDFLILGIFAVIILPCSVSSDNPLSSYDVLFGWKELDYNFTTPEQRQRYLESNEFVKENNVITGIKVHGTRVYLTVPRWRNGIPSTLNWVEMGTPGNEPVLLNPYPNWEMQTIGNCDALQYIQSMEIDRWGRMWAVDVGRTEIFKRKNEYGIGRCKAKVVLIDLNDGRVLHKHEFPEDVVSPTTNFLNDVVVGCDPEDRQKCFAYISDALDARLVIYDLSTDRSWFVHHRSMQIDPQATTIPILGTNYTFNTNIDGIALSSLDQNHDRVYFAPLSSFGLYSVEAAVLKTAVNGAGLKDSDVTSHDRRSSQCDGMAMDSQGLLFYGLLSNNSVVYMNTSGSAGFHKEILLIQSDIDLQWADTFAFDDKGYLYVVSNRIHRFQTNTLDWNEVNFRVARVYIGSKSYMYSAKEKVSTASPEISSNDNDDSIPTNFDANAPETPVGVNVDRKDNERYDHHGNNELGQGDSDTHGRHSSSNGHLNSHQTSSAPPVNQQLPVVLFLSGLMFNPVVN